MSKHDSARAARRRRRIFRAQRARLRGWLINWKMLLAAYVLEAGIITSGIIAGVIFANKYGGDGSTLAPTQVAQLGGWLPHFVEGHTQDWYMMVTATLAFALAEVARLPLIHGFRTAPSYVMRGFLLIGVLLAVGVTVKTISQVAEQNFHPRLRFVQDANTELSDAQRALESVQARRSASDKQTSPREDELKRLDEQILAKEKSLQEMGPQPKLVCTKAVYGKKNRKTGKRPLLHGAKCSQPAWSGNEILAEIDELRADRNALAASLSTANAKAADIDVQIADAQAVLTRAENKHMKAVADSQLHSFTGMVFGKDPREVTDGEVHWFLRLFVFLPAVCVALASSLLAIGSYVPVRRPREVQPIIVQLPGAIRDAANDSGGTGAASGGASRALVAAPSLLEA